MADVVSALKRVIDGKGETHMQRKRHRLLFISVVGVLLMLITFIAMLCIGPTEILGPGKALSSLFSAISKGGSDLSDCEVVVYSSRFPRAITAIAVGLGLSIAGSAYQAVIRNPLVDPYIMGVSSGASTFAIAVIAFDFTFFGLFASTSLYLMAVSSIVGVIPITILIVCVAFKKVNILVDRNGNNRI